MLENAIPSALTITILLLILIAISNNASSIITNNCNNAMSKCLAGGESCMEVAVSFHDWL